MQVEIADSAVFGKEEARASLQRVLMRAREGQHTLIVGDVDGFLQSPFFTRSVAEADREEVAELVRIGQAGGGLIDRGLDPYAGARASVVTDGELSVADTHQWRVPAELAGEFLEAPLLLVVENEADANLVWGAARVYEAETVLEARRHGERWLRVDPRGGSGGVLDRARSTRPVERVFVIHDADHGDPTGEARATEIIKARNGRPWMVVWTWKKREADNYLPAVLLVKATDRRKAGYRAWSRMEPAERDRIDMAQLFGTHGAAWVREWLAGKTPDKGNGGKSWLRDRILEFGQLTPEHRGGVTAVAGTELADLVARIEALL